METIIKGGNLMVFAAEDTTPGALTEPSSIPLATSHTLRITSDTTDVSNKDVASGRWKANEVGQMSWEATTENLYCENGGQWLFQMMTSGNYVNVVFAQKDEDDGDELPAGGSWTPKDNTGWQGEAIITSLEITAQNGENATLSATFTGYGELVSLASSSTTTVTSGQLDSNNSPS